MLSGLEGTNLIMKLGKFMTFINVLGTAKDPDKKWQKCKTGDSGTVR